MTFLLRDSNIAAHSFKSNFSFLSLSNSSKIVRSLPRYFEARGYRFRISPAIASHSWKELLSVSFSLARLNSHLIVLVMVVLFPELQKVSKHVTVNLPVSSIAPRQSGEGGQ